MAKRALTAVASAAASSSSVGAGSALAPSSFWLLKSEPADYSIAAMAKERVTMWDGVRNAVARKNLRAMRVGDRCLFYHSSCGAKVGVVGEVAVCRAAYPDPTDAAWAVVDVEHLETWPSTVTLPTLKAHAQGALSGMALFAQSRLSVQPVSKEHYEFVRSLRDDAVGAPKDVDEAAGGKRPKTRKG